MYGGGASRKGYSNMNANAFVHWGLSLASDILEICKEGKAAAIVDAINN